MATQDMNTNQDMTGMGEGIVRTTTLEVKGVVYEASEDEQGFRGIRVFSSGPVNEYLEEVDIQRLYEFLDRIQPAMDMDQGDQGQGQGQYDQDQGGGGNQGGGQGGNQGQGGGGNQGQGGGGNYQARQRRGGGQFQDVMGRTHDADGRFAPENGNQNYQQRNGGQGQGGNQGQGGGGNQGQQRQGQGRVTNPNDSRLKGNENLRPNDKNPRRSGQ